ncbi:MAG: hypothetical protein A2506_11590 [Elusimicrobia bacterium RIFOXYD12_FULL_66_9]|nr:MAG: hypothetical protein A2506_11590 [Elusimicrobia bacterium RIFOXYD12_FULL_66_9]
MFMLGCLVATAVSPLWAQKAGDAGVGVVLGAPTAITGKLWLDGTRALDAGLGWNSELTVYGDYLWHGWNVLPQPAEGKLPVYLGLGAQVRTYHDAEFGIRTVAGVAYWFPRDPVEVFLELVPVFRVTPGTSVGLEAGLGLRYYFKS